MTSSLLLGFSGTSRVSFQVDVYAPKPEIGMLYYEDHLPRLGKASRPGEIHQITLCLRKGADRFGKDIGDRGGGSGSSGDARERLAALVSLIWYLVTQLDHLLYFLFLLSLPNCWLIKFATLELLHSFHQYNCRSCVDINKTKKYSATNKFHY